jgi:hypothetical protein
MNKFLKSLFATPPPEPEKLMEYWGNLCPGARVQCSHALAWNKAGVVQKIVDEAPSSDWQVVIYVLIDGETKVRRFANGDLKRIG